MTLNLILASSYPASAIGSQGGLPWQLPGDLAYFRRMTTRHPSAIIMGRRTWESFGSKPLPRRQNIVVSKTLCDAKSRNSGDNNLKFASSLKSALSDLDTDLEVFIIGGAQIYEEAAKCNSREVIIHHTEVYADYPAADVFWKIPTEYIMRNAGLLENVIDGISGKQTWFRRIEWVRPVDPVLFPVISHVSEYSCNPEEGQYLDLLHKVYVTGAISTDRTGSETRSIMGGHFRFNLRTGFPAITTKPLFWKGVVEELLWILSGDTNAKHLASCGVHIWDADTKLETLQRRGLDHLSDGDAGATYGFNMRHYGAEYKGCEADYTGAGVDQLVECVRLLMENPADRRIIINLWNPSTANKCALPPCLLMYIFYVSNGELSCFLVQRSADLMLGVPFNFASSSLLTHILANMAGLTPGDVDHNIVNAHIYPKHLDAAREQMERRPYAKCILQMPMNEDGSVKKLTIDDIDAKPRMLKWSDFKLVGYRCWPKLKNATPMAY